MGRRSTFLDFEDLALELITRAQLLHGSLLSKNSLLRTMPRSAPSAVSARSPWLPRTITTSDWLRDDPLKSAFLKSRDPYCGSDGAAKPYFANTCWPWIDKINRANW